MEEIPIIWKKPHNSSNLVHVGTINILLDRFIKRYRERLQIQQIMIDLEIANKTFIIKLHLKLRSGKILRAESEQRSIADVMENITKEIDNQSRSTDRQKHTDSIRKLG